MQQQQQQPLSERHQHPSEYRPCIAILAIQHCGAPTLASISLAGPPCSQSPNRARRGSLPMSSTSPPANPLLPFSPPPICACLPTCAGLPGQRQAANLGGGFAPCSLHPTPPFMMRRLAPSEDLRRCPPGFAPSFGTTGFSRSTPTAFAGRRHFFCAQSHHSFVPGTNEPTRAYSTTPPLVPPCLFLLCQHCPHEPSTAPASSMRCPTVPPHTQPARCPLPLLPAMHMPLRQQTLTHPVTHYPPHSGRAALAPLFHSYPVPRSSPCTALPMPPMSHVQPFH